MKKDEDRNSKEKVMLEHTETHPFVEHGNMGAWVQHFSTLLVYYIKELSTTKFRSCSVIIERTKNTMFKNETQTYGQNTVKRTEFSPLATIM